MFILADIIRDEFKFIIENIDVIKEDEIVFKNKVKLPLNPNIFSIIHE